MGLGEPKGESMTIERACHWTANPINGLSFWEKQCSKVNIAHRLVPGV